jgi:hypothetical protein
MICSFHNDGLSRSRPAVRTAATVLGEVRDEPVHVLEVGGIDYEAPLLLARSQSRTGKVRQVKGKRSGRQSKTLTNSPGCHAFGASFHQQSEDREAAFLSQSGECFDRLCHFHISNNIEILSQRQRV